MRRSPLDGLGVGVNDLAQARAALAWAAAGRHGRLRLYGLDARLMGAGFWFEVERILDRPVVVDCGDHVGTALGALRTGCRHLHVSEVGPQEEALAGLIEAYGATRVAAPPALVLAPGRPVAAQLGRARCEQVTAPPPPAKERMRGTANRPDTGHVACD